MPSPPVKKPIRIPPASHGKNPSSPAVRPPERPGSGMPINVEADTVTKDAFALQDHLDLLENQFAQMRAQLRQTQKLAALGTTTAMIAHEFNNFFTPIVAYAQHALDTEDVELMRIALKRTLANIASMRHMADQVLGLAKQSDDVRKPIHVKELVDNALVCLGRDLSKDNITVNIQIDSALAVRANENQLLQVLYNLIINARQAMLGKRGRLTVDAACTPDGQVEINVRDTGCGIEPGKIERIFEPFYSTKQNANKPDQKGLGLGLSICREIIEELDGSIEVASEKGAGTTFTIILPQAD